METINKEALNQRLLEVCLADPVDYELAEELLKQGAEPMGAIDSESIDNKDNLYTEVVFNLFHNEDTEEDLFFLTELFLRYGLDLSKPAVPYDDNNVLNPLWDFGFFSNDTVMRTLKILLDNGLSADSVALCWGHAISDLANLYGRLEDETDYEFFYDYIKKLMLIASYPHVLDVDTDLQEEIWFRFNDYDLSKFRDWNNFSYDVDTSHCVKDPEVYRSVVTIIEKESGKPVWKFGVSISPEEIAKENP